MRKALILAAAAALVGTLVLAGCSKRSSPTAQSRKIGASVSVLAGWSGSERDVFNNMIKPFVTRTEVKVKLTTAPDVNAVLATRIQAGSPPDTAVFPGLGEMVRYAREGTLVDLSRVLDISRMKQQYARSWFDLGSVDGKLVGILLRASLKGLIWYVPSQMQAEGITVPPKSWDELMADSRRLVDAGKTPWTIALKRGSSGERPGVDWIEDFVLRTAGPDKYEQWYEGKLKWTSPEITKAWQMFGRIVNDPKMEYGGKQFVLSTNLDQTFMPMFMDPPGAFFMHQATFMQSMIQSRYPDKKPVQDFDFFGFPQIDSRYAKAIEVAGDMFGMFTDTPQAEAFADYLTTPEAQSYWAKSGSGLSANRNVDLSVYPHPLSKRAALILTDADIAVFDASDMMPQAMNDAFSSAIMSFVQNPDDLQGVLQHLDQVQAEAYQDS